jgi:DNA-binding MarR family transcriptional regulator
LIHRNQDLNDRRRIQLEVTTKGHRILRTLSEDHERELYELAPRLIGALSRICGADAPATKGRGSAAMVRGDYK